MSAFGVFLARNFWTHAISATEAFPVSRTECLNFPCDQGSGDLLLFRRSAVCGKTNMASLLWQAKAEGSTHVQAHGAILSGTYLFGNNCIGF